MLLVSYILVSALSELVEAGSIALCQQYQNVTTANGLYTLDTDQWGEDGSGGQCLFVDPEYEPISNATALTAVWTWYQNATEVHSFPNVNLNSPLIPLPLSNLNTLTLDTNWTIGPGTNSASHVTTVSDLAALSVRTDVALDMFLDQDSKSAQNSSLAKYECMIWLGAYGGAVPTGFTNNSQAPILNISNNLFSLTIGTNPSTSQTVYTWLPASNISTFNADVSPLLHYLWRQNFIPETAKLGVVQFGNEAEHTLLRQNVTFSASHVRMDLQQGTPKPEPTPVQQSNGGSSDHSGSLPSSRINLNAAVAVAVLSIVAVSVL